MYLMLPAYLANMAPPFARFWPGWNRQISRRWLGDHKTAVGFCAGLGVALVLPEKRLAMARSLADRRS
jgi:hypothetical protein